MRRSTEAGGGWVSLLALWRYPAIAGLVRRYIAERRRGALRRSVQIALQPASKTLGFHGVVIRGKGLQYVTADSAFERMQVDARPFWLDTGQHHRGLAPRTRGALDCNEWNGGR